MNRLLTTHKARKSGKLFEDWQADIKALIRAEINLVKVELRENVRPATLNAALGLAGAALALFGVFILLLGCAIGLALYLQSAGLSAPGSFALAFGGMSLVLLLSGILMLRVCRAGFARIRLNTEQSRAALIGEEVPIQIRNVASAPPAASALQAEVAQERSRIKAETDELKRRVSPGYAVRSAWGGLKRHPLRAVMLGSTLGGLIWWRHRQHA